MTRTEMRAVLASGGTVLHKGKHIRSESELPSEAELAVDGGTEASALEAVQAQFAKLLAEKELLEKALAEKEREKDKKPSKQEAAATKSDEEKLVAKK